MHITPRIFNSPQAPAYLVGDKNLKPQISLKPEMTNTVKVLNMRKVESVLKRIPNIQLEKLMCGTNKHHHFGISPNGNWHCHNCMSTPLDAKLLVKELSKLPPRR